jgi:hypothetical protein
MRLKKDGKEPALAWPGAILLQTSLVVERCVKTYLIIKTVFTSVTVFVSVIRLSLGDVEPCCQKWQSHGTINEIRNHMV